MFSNSMLKKRSFNPNAQITCRKHTAGGAVTELLCSSCQKHKALEYFSKSERKSSGGQRCRACVEWVVADEPDHIPLPAPNSLRDHEEREVYKGNLENPTVRFCGDDDDDYVAKNYHSDGDDTFVTEGQVDASEESWVGRSKENTGAETGGLTFENLKHIDDARNPSSASSRGGGSYHPSSAPTDSASTTGTEVTARPGNARKFNAFGPNGQFQRRQAGTASSVTSATSRSTTGSNGWARPATRKYAPAMPRHMEYENPDAVGYDEFDDDDSSDGC